VTILTPAERLLHELGITEPNEIDVEAIAYHVGARARYLPLDGCEARIIGCADNAIITVNEHSSYRRKRFSIAHELGHWCYHRGKALVCRVEEIRPRDPTSPERIADAYAADLLMPHYLFRPAARQQPKLTFKAVSTLAEIFHTSQTATAIRLVEGDHSPALLVCHGKLGRKWFVRAPSVPEQWFPRNELDADSFAFGVLYGGNPDDALPRKIGAEAWFDRWEASRYEVHEQTIRTGEDEILTFILITDAHMLEDRDNRGASRSR
jgi:IrrE N-terminal-like domain